MELKIMNKEFLIQKSISHCKTQGYTDVVKIATELNIGVYMVDENDDFNARIEMDPITNEVSINVNENHPISRQRFSIAHELAHYVLHSEKLKREGKINRSDIGDENYNNEEMEADALAAEFLLPTELVNEFMSDKLIEDRITNKKYVFDLAKEFNVSIITAIIRLKTLGYKVPYISFS